MIRMLVKIKEGVVFKEINDFYLAVFDALAKALPGHIPTITSATDGKHTAKSYHYSSGAVDVRTHDLPCKPDGYAMLLRHLLGKRFDVVVEKDHIHIEKSPSYGKA